LIKPISEKYDVSSVSGILIRRATDPHDKKGGPINSVQWEANSHHGEDVNSVIDKPKMNSIAFLVPHTLTHVNSLIIRFNEDVPSKEDIQEIFSKESRVAVLQNATSTSQIIEIARDLGLKRYDTYIPCLLLNTYNVVGNEIFISFTVPQESIVIPENIDAIVAQCGLMKQKESIEYTNKILGIDKIKKNLEEIFG